MASKLGKYLTLLLLFLCPNLSVLASIDLDIKNSSIISKEYLDKLPPNDYILGPGDNLNVIVSRDYPELTSSSKIDGEGTIYLPKLNRVFVEGLNIQELVEVLNKAYEEYIRFPDVEVIVEEYRAIRVLVDGEVENPGLQTLKGAFTLTSSQNELALVNNNSLNIGASSFFPLSSTQLERGGITPFTDLTNIQVIRKNSLSQGGGLITTTIDFSKVLVSGDTTENIRIYDSDIIILKKLKWKINFC